MSEEPRRSGRATKGQHNKASSSPAPAPKAVKSGTKAKSKKSNTKSNADDDSGEEDQIRCICGNDDPNDKRAFIGCDACTVWQHNVCMGEPEDEDDVPDHYFCEECRPEEHRETLTALAKGEKIWEWRAQQYKQWKKMSSQRRKSKGKGGEDARPTWLKKEIREAEPAGHGTADSQETGGKRKRESVKPDPEELEARPSTEDKSVSLARPDKRRKSSQAPSKGAIDVDTAVVDIEQLPGDRRKIAEMLSKIITDDVETRAKSGHRTPDGQTAKSLGEKYGGLIEYSCFMNHGGPKEDKYKQQVRNLGANMKRNKRLTEQLLDGSLKPDELSLMDSKDMLSEEKQREQEKLKAELDRQTIAVQDEGPIYKQTHKGYEKVEDERHQASDFASNPAPVRERASIAEEGGTDTTVANAGSPVTSATPGMQMPSMPSTDRRTSSQQNFDMNAIWSKTAQSPTTANAQPTRPMQMPPRRRSSAAQHPQQSDGAKDDPDVDRLLQDDDDEDYSPAEAISDQTVVWRGKILHDAVGEPIVNARFVAGRDLSPTAPWRDLLPANLNIDGRLQIVRAEDYLCGLEWSQSSDVSVLALTPYDDATGFNKVFEYFLSRQRYAVVHGGKPKMVKDLYIIPVERGADLPEHIEKLEHCTIKLPVEERLLLATLVVQRAPQPQTPSAAQPHGSPVSGANGGILPQHMRNGGHGPSGSPLNPQGPTFSPANTGQQQPVAGYGAPYQQAPQIQPDQFPPNPYAPGAHHGPAYPLPSQAQPPVQYQQSPGPYQQASPAVQPPQHVVEILGPYLWAPMAQQAWTQGDLDAEKCKHLRRIFDDNPEARTNMEALARALAF